MIDKIDELIKYYKSYTGYWIESQRLCEDILSDLEELKKSIEDERQQNEDHIEFMLLRDKGHSIGCAHDMVLANEKCRCKLAEFINAQQDLPEGVSKVVDENFWELAEEK